MPTVEPWPMMGNTLTGYNSGTIYTDNTTTWYPPANQVYVYGGASSVETPRDLIAKYAPIETPEQWLRRRVEEVCWKPA
jgi:hypothetical protein